MADKTIDLKKDMLRDISRVEAPSLHRAVDELARIVGIHKPDICYINSNRCNPLQRHLFERNAFAWERDGKPVMIFGKETRRLFGYHSGHSHVSEEFKAIITHEMGHIKHGDVFSKYGEFLEKGAHIWAPVAVAAGIFFHDYLKAKKNAHINHGMSQEQADYEVHQEWERSDSIDHPAFQHMQPLVTAAKMAAGASLGFAGALIAFNLWHRKIEFRADSVSAAAMGSGQPQIRALKTLTDAMENDIMPREAVSLTAQLKPMTLIHMMLTHPRNAERFKKLESFVPGR